MRNIIIALASLISVSAIAQTGPGPVPEPWSYGPSLSLFYNNGGLTLGTPTGGTEGVGTINVSGGFYVNGSPVATIGSQSANKIYASPNGSSGTPTFRSFANGDLPVNVAITGTLGVTGATSIGALSASGAISGVGFLAFLSSPPPIGSITPNTIAATTLSASGTVSGAGMDTYSAARIAAGLPGVFSTYSVGANGLVGDGSTNNNTALQAALTAAAAGANGGEIHIPCGVYKITAAMAVTVASGKGLKLNGGGQKCTTIAVSGAVDGITITQADETAGIDLKDFSITTDQAGTQFGITLIKTTANVLNAYAVPISFQNVSLYGSDFPNAANPTKYWSNALILNNVNNVSMINMFVIGGGCVASLCNGNGIYVVGKGSGSYGVVYNISNSNFGLCSTALFYGDWIQGVFLNGFNATGCQYGVYIAQTPAGLLDELSVVNSQFNNGVSDFYLNVGASGNLVNVSLANNVISQQLTGETLLNLKGVNNATILDNVFTGGTGSTNIAVSGTDLGIVINGNDFNGPGTGISVAASSSLNGSVIANNSFFGETTKYSIGAGVTGLTIIDPQPSTIAGLFSCIAGLDGSRAYVADTIGAAVPTYHLIVAGSGGTAVHSPVYCDGSGPNWKYD